MTKNRHFSGSELWTVLQNTRLPIVMYGMGNGADKILEVLDKKEIAVSDFFASDGFVRGHSFHGKRVLSFEEIPGMEERKYVLHKPEMECSHHLHMHCVKCGKVFHLNCSFMDEIAHHLNEEHGFVIDCEKSVLMGLCEECRKEEE